MEKKVKGIEDTRHLATPSERGWQNYTLKIKQEGDFKDFKLNDR